MATSLVTGGAGFIGSHLVRRLIERGQIVRVLDNLSTGRRENLGDVPVDLMVADLLDPEAVRDAVHGAEVVYHLAAMISVPRSMEDPIGAYRSNVLGSLHVLEAARREGVRRVVLSSSCAVYGDAAGPVSEATSPRPQSPYAASKLAMEDLASLYHNLYGLETVCLRYFNVYGPRQDPASPYSAVIPIFIRAMLDGVAPQVHGDGGQSRDFVYVDDVAAANLLAGEAADAQGAVFNVGTRAVREPARIAGRTAGPFSRSTRTDVRPGSGGGYPLLAGRDRRGRQSVGIPPGQRLATGPARDGRMDAPRATRLIR